ncbi:KATNB1-like protein 1 [Notolabrus celidotus]|uniref:KATNB1-like protein 1 n=1 Tax=Notolabrus celidotus TaxID=1203425 RepID=UPI00148F93D7|nr:KATNB1-like protein 1 [Notolabrus celidotus]XP_034530670.1 KATNB1-like protein 1 [Notolabrus celidotus]XP_034530671.1 KATNB1-like protein 1 [Notolabrus celidotus]
MDSNSEDGESQNLGHALHRDETPYRVTYTHGRNTKHEEYDKNEDNFIKKRNPVSRSGSGRLKRVVSCKRKTYHMAVARRKQIVSGRTYDAANKENEMNCLQDMHQEIFDMDPWDFPLSVNNNHKTGRTGSEQADYCTLTELTRDHSTMTDVLFGRNLRLKVSLTLWQRNVGELLTYFLRIQDIGVLVDFLPLISKSIEEDSPRISIGCCVDLFPLVKKVLTNPYEEYLNVGLKWIHSVLINWCEELRASGFSGSTTDKNFQLFNQQLLDLWHQEPSLKFVPGTAGDMAKVVDSFLSQLT